MLGQLWIITVTSPTCMLGTLQSSLGRHGALQPCNANAVQCSHFGKHVLTHRWGSPVSALSAAAAAAAAEGAAAAPSSAQIPSEVFTSVSQANQQWLYHALESCHLYDSETHCRLVLLGVCFFAPLQVGSLPQTHTTGRDLQETARASCQSTSSI